MLEKEAEKYGFNIPDGTVARQAKQHQFKHQINSI